MVGGSINYEKDCGFLGHDLLQGVAFFQHGPERTGSADSRPDTTSRMFYADSSRWDAKHLPCRHELIPIGRDRNRRDPPRPCREIAHLLLLPVALPIISDNTCWTGSAMPLGPRISSRGRFLARWRIE